ncbi:MAG: hypothetical protein ACTS7E_00850 [Arsenophonus sp. NC-CH8-MAG3]
MFSYLLCMLNSLTSLESAKQTGIDLKQHLDRHQYFLASAVTRQH